MPSPPKHFQKRQRLTKQRELQSCDLRRQLPAITNVELAVVTKTREQIRPRFQCELDQCIVEYVLMCDDIQVSLTGEMIMMRARKMAKLLGIPPSSLPNFPWSWLRHVQVRYGIRWKRAHGESGAVDLEAAAPKLECLRGIIGTYSHSNVYNMDETGFCYDNVPRGSICIREAPALKQSKSRITLAVCINATGTHKLPLFFIGKSRQPRWIKNKPVDIDYKSTARAWMDTETFQSWLLGLNKMMQGLNRQMLLLLDNASSNCKEGVALNIVRVEKLSANTTSKLQPLDQGVIYCLKRAVLRIKMNHALEKIDEGVETPFKVGMLQDIKWCAAAWEESRSNIIGYILR